MVRLMNPPSAESFPNALSIRTVKSLLASESTWSLLGPPTALQLSPVPRPPPWTFEGMEGSRCAMSRADAGASEAGGLMVTAELAPVVEVRGSVRAGQLADTELWDREGCRLDETTTAPMMSATTNAIIRTQAPRFLGGGGVVNGPPELPSGQEESEPMSLMDWTVEAPPMAAQGRKTFGTAAPAAACEAACNAHAGDFAEARATCRTTPPREHFNTRRRR